MALYPFGQRFPNPSPPRFRRVLALVAHRYRFEVVSLQLLRPLELASAMTFEGYFIQVRDRDGKPYVAIAGASRGTMHGAQASAVDDEFPYAHG
jgi:hypothetical protein